MSSRLPGIVGILNGTPDSFSGDGIAANALMHRVHALIDQGADVVDIGGESTRPGAVSVTAEEEWARIGYHLAGVVQLVHQAGTLISVDTRHELTAHRALDCGVDWINFVSGDPSDGLIDRVATSSARIVLMHNLGIPADRNRVMPSGQDPLGSIQAWGEMQVGRLEARGVQRSQIIVDPGIGFGKTGDQSWQIVRAPERIRMEGIALLYGHSRKSFLASCGGNDAAQRDPETHLVSLYLGLHGVDYLRVHDVAGCRQALRVGSQLLGELPG